jgi:hypothetical protein
MCAVPNSEDGRISECQSNFSMIVSCVPYSGVQCTGSQQFYLSLPCVYVGEHSWRVAFALSVFGGFLGLDRLYLGYVTTGIFKLFTFGGFGIVYISDVMLLSIQVRPYTLVSVNYPFLICLLSFCFPALTCS